MREVFQLTLDIGVAVLLIICGVPDEDFSNNLNVEPIRMACTATTQNGETFLFAGKVFKIQNGEADGMWQ